MALPGLRRFWYYSFMTENNTNNSFANDLNICDLSHLFSLIFTARLHDPALPGRDAWRNDLI